MTQRNGLLNYIKEEQRHIYASVWFKGAKNDTILLVTLKCQRHIPVSYKQTSANIHVHAHCS